MQAYEDFVVKKKPLEYVLGYVEFLKNKFKIYERALIPRPETEELVRCAIAVAKTLPNPPKILDVGTGSGCIAITLAKELPTATITGIDISEKALEVAKTNAKRLKAKVDFYQSNLLEKTQKYDIIIANLPYVNKDWDWLSPELAYEPQTALYSSENGLALIKELIRQLPSHLYSNAHLILEADLTQHAEIKEYAQKYGFSSASSALISKDSLALCLYHH